MVQEQGRRGAEVGVTVCKVQYVRSAGCRREQGAINDGYSGDNSMFLGKSHTVWGPSIKTAIR